ncbi:MAG: xylose isomerase [Hyphomicrobiales bacterium]|nr:MAG: xylose isomerase [Hyphomicrobiales bacterium]
MTKFSYQLYSSRNFPPLSDTLAMLGRLGYAQVEGYGGLYSNLDDIDTLKADLKKNNLHMATGHFGLDMVTGETDRVLKIASELNIEAVFVPAIPESERTQDSAGWRALGEKLAEAGETYAKEGIKFGWHNHAFEFVETAEGDMPLDLIFGAGDKLLLEFDVAWAVKGNQDPVKWIEKYSDRIVAAHLKDIAPAGQCEDEDGWADLGEGTMDWKGIMQALAKTNSKYFVMEHDNPNDHERFARRSIAAANGLVA